MLWLSQPPQGVTPFWLYGWLGIDFCRYHLPAVNRTLYCSTQGELIHAGIQPTSHHPGWDYPVVITRIVQSGQDSNLLATLCICFNTISDYSCLRYTIRLPCRHLTIRSDIRVSISLGPRWASDGLQSGQDSNLYVVFKLGVHLFYIKAWRRLTWHHLPPD